VKKPQLEAMIRDLQYKLEAQSAETARERRRNQTLTAEVEQMREHWRPVPLVHEWEPLDPRCALCDEPRSAARHQVDR
jgi:hypothetical protein